MTKGFENEIKRIKKIIFEMKNKFLIKRMEKYMVPTKKNVIGRFK